MQLRAYFIYPSYSTYRVGANGSSHILAKYCLAGLWGARAELQVLFKPAVPPKDLSVLVPLIFSPSDGYILWLLTTLFTKPNGATSTA